MPVKTPKHNYHVHFGTFGLLCITPSVQMKCSMDFNWLYVNVV